MIAALLALALVPAPTAVRVGRCTVPLAHAMTVPAAADAGGMALLRERWNALHVPSTAGRDVRASLKLLHRSGGNAEAYTLRVDARGIVIGSSTPEGQFDALATLAQLPQRDANGWHLPCVDITDAPAMRRRIVSDDVSRGPFPTMSYAKERIRGLASLKINGWSPYMENVVVDPRSPFVAFPNGWTAAQLRELTTYAARFHVTLIPEQQTFAHMHETVKWERYAPLAELPHGYLVAESDPATYAYLGPLVHEVLDATHAPFVHLGADEPLDLGQGRTPRSPQTVAAHITRVAGFLDGRARPIVWDDAIQQDHAILGLIPKNTIVATFHYGVETSYKPYIDTIADAGFDQLISPGASNWNELYPDLASSYANTSRFVRDARGARGVLGMFFTVWHDDGETLYEATWPAVAYAAASAWQSTPVDDATWHATFAQAFFGTSDPRYAQALDALRDVRVALKTSPSDPPDYTYWADPFSAALQTRAATLDIPAIRNRAEDTLTALWTATPPLHVNAARIMRLAAMRYDILGRRLQIGAEAHADYDAARALAVKPDVSQVYRDLNLAKYLCWELRDGIADAEPWYEAAWRYESTEPGLARITSRARTAEDDAQRCADALDAAQREDYLRMKMLRPWSEVMSWVR
jgi:hypothetical protein